MKAKLLLLCCVLFSLSCFAGETEFVQDVVYGKGGDESLKLDIYRPKDKSSKPMPAVVFMHPGGWTQGDKSESGGKTGVKNVFLNSLASKGYFCVSINYRLAPKNIFPAQIEDSKCAVRFLRAKAKEYNIDPERIAARGGSAGGHLAALVGTAGDVKEFEGTGGWEGFSSKVQAVIDLCGPVDLYKWKNQSSIGNMLIDLFGGASPKYKDAIEKASPIKHINKDTPLFLLIHGDKDNIVSIKQSQAFAEALTKAGVEVNFITVKGGPHGARANNQETIEEEFLNKWLKK